MILDLEPSKDQCCPFNPYHSFGLQVLLLKRDKRELELKVHDQEEELDEQAGQIQMLEQV